MSTRVSYRRDGDDGEGFRDRTVTPFRRTASTTERREEKEREESVIEHQVPSVVYITPLELVTLLGETFDGSVDVDARFGGGRTWLEDVPTNRWAFKRLAQLRGVGLVDDA